MHRAIADFRTLREDGVIADVALDPPAPATMTVVLADGSTRQCQATDRSFASLLADLRASQDRGDAS